MNELFTLRAKLSQKKSLLIEVCGFIFFISLWWAVCAMGLIPEAILPSPLKVITSYWELHFEDELVRNFGYSIKLNLLGYLEAVAIALPLGYLIGLYPIGKALASRYIDAIRFLPLTACTGIFISWFGIDDFMKVQFLAFGIIVYLLPVVVTKVVDLDDVYTQTTYTLGATQWQTIKSVFIPSVSSKVFDDIRVLVAISWTYIIIAELLNRTAGIGSLIFVAQRQSRVDKVFAILFLIILLGFVQDKVFQWLDKKFFKYKYA